MTDQIYSMPGASESRFVKKAFGKHLRSRQKCNKKRRAAKPKTKFELMSNEILQASSEKMLKRLLKDHRKPIAGGDILDSVLNANLGKKFLLKKRADQRKFLAIGCAVYHAIAARKNPEEAFERLKQSAGLEQLRTRDPCALIVHCLVDYGDTKSETLRNRQYAARDARALSYIVRTEMEPQEVEEPEKGETITKWAERESAYRSKQKPLRVCGKKSTTEKFSALDFLDNGVEKTVDIGAPNLGQCPAFPRADDLFGENSRDLFARRSPSNGAWHRPG